MLASLLVKIQSGWKQRRSRTCRSPLTFRDVSASSAEHKPTILIFSAAVSPRRRRRHRPGDISLLLRLTVDAGLLVLLGQTHAPRAGCSCLSGLTHAREQRRKGGGAEVGARVPVWYTGTELGPGNAARLRFFCFLKSVFVLHITL